MVHSFYDKATRDFMIGYHFRKIATLKGANPLRPPIEAFKDHLPRIEQFWQVQLLGESEGQMNFDLLKAHSPLQIKRAELGRWLLLFKETLESEIKGEDDFKKKWLEKLPIFEKMFERLL